ncbi:MAG: hypothetical protein ABIH53_01875 [archaeon]
MEKLNENETKVLKHCFEEPLNTEDMAASLEMEKEELESVLNKLKELGLIQQNTLGWWGCTTEGDKYFKE